MSSRGTRPLNNSISSESQISPHDPHPREVARVLDTITKISDASAEIIRRLGDEEDSRLPAATLHRVSTLSKSLWKEVMSLPLPTIPPLHKTLIIYELILVDIQRILSTSDPVDISDDKIDRRLDDFQLQFQEALDLLKGPTGQRSSPNSPQFFSNAHHLIITGGNFISNLVVHDPVLREQCRKILQVAYIQCVVLFA